jgi:hypothetical protein
VEGPIIVDLIVLSCLDKLIFILKILFTFVSEQATVMRSTVLSLPPQLVFPGFTYLGQHNANRIGDLGAVWPKVAKAS